MSFIFLFWKAFFCYAWAPLYVGGDTSSKTDTTVQNYDQRQVNTFTSETYDLSTRDNSQNSHNTYVTDGGAIAAMGANVQEAYNYADSIFDHATDAINSAGGRELNAYDRAATLVQDALTGAKAAFSTAQNLTQAAYADAKGTSDSQKQIMLGVLAVAGVMALSMMSRKG